MSNGVKQELDSFTAPPNGNGNKRTLKEESESELSSEDEKPLAKRVKPTPAPAVDSSSEDDKPLASASASKKRKAAPKSSSPSQVSESEDDKPLARKARTPAKKKKVVKEESGSEEEEEESEDEKPLARKKRAPPKKKAKAESASPEKKPAATATKAKGKKVKGKHDEEDEKEKTKEQEEEESYEWWVSQGALGDGTTKWTTLEHAGVLFPPAYEPLPASVKMRYDGKPVDLPPEAEEVAGFYAAVVGTDHAEDEVFNENFFGDFREVLKKHPPRDGTKITTFSKCDFTPMHEHLEREKEKRKALTREEKKVIKAARDEMEKPYTTCLLDGRKEKVGNFRIEPPGLFRGRGKHPKKGKLKLRIRPEQVTINIGKDAKVPDPPEGTSWKALQHDQTVTWLATWKENINGNIKYVFLAPGSSLKGQSDMSKFEKARELKKHIDRIRADYTKDLTNKVTAERQRATAMYLIDRLALRAGNEKGEDEADTVGCCSLRCEHITLSPPNLVTFDFLGKDSIRFFQENVPIDEQVFKNLRIFKKEPKKADDPVFDRLNTSQLNKHLTSYMKGLSAKVFRTYNASITFQRELESTPKKASVAEKLLAYNRANRVVAVLCNHQKSVSKTHAASMERMGDRLRALKYQRMKLRQTLLVLEPKAKKKHSQFMEEESDLEDEWIASYEDDQLEKDKEKARKKFEKENEKLKAEGEKEQKASVLEERLEALDENYKVLKQERKTGKPDPGKKGVDQVLKALEKIEERIAAFKVQVKDKDEGKETSLGTSKINYLDPRITIAWCKKHEVPLEKVFPKTLITKFKWAAETPADYDF